MDEIHDTGTIIHLTRLTARPESRKELCQTISSLLDSFKSETGCVTYHFYEEAGNDNTFVLIGEWETSDAWRDHLNSDNFAILRGSINILCNRSHSDFQLLSPLAGVEAMTRARIGCH